MQLPFLPTEVDKLSDINKKDETIMTNAILLGPLQNHEGLIEKPAIYNTVITGHKTGVAHPIPQPVTYAVNQLTVQAFAINSPEEGSRPEELAPGAYSIPVKVGGSTIGDATLSGYETPSFIHKKETIKTNEKAKSTTKQEDPHPEQTVADEMNTFIGQFENSKDKAERSNILLQGKTRLAAESQELRKKIEADIKELLFAKEVAIKLNNLIVNYEQKLTKDTLSKMKLSDEITIKNLLRDKLQREMQGFITSPGEYKELDAINPEDLQRIIGQIKQKIGE